MKAQFAVTKKQKQDAFTVRRRVFVEEQGVPADLEIDPYDDEAIHFVLYNEESDAIGAGRFRTIDGNGKIERICIDTDVRHGGGGKLIMEAIEQYALQRGIRLLKLNSQTTALRFYEKLGYSSVSDEFLEAGIPHRTMMKHL
ncbi:MAG: GNAT family N-acetyltransferase [Bacillus sp. (in: firmicutes)]